MIILKIIGKNKNLIKNSKERDGKDFGYFMNSSKAERRYKWKSKTSLESGLVETINWVKKNKQIINKLDLDYKHKK